MVFPYKILEQAVE